MLLHRCIAAISVFSVGLIATALTAAGARAQETNNPADTAADTVVMEHVVVRGAFFGQRKASGTKTPTLLLDVPQSISVFGAEQINDQAMSALTEVLQYSPGVSLGQGEDHRDQITIRGQNTTADFFVDGLRDDVQYFRPLYNLERVEILRGSNALLFGRGGGGGVVNRVTKVATPDDRFTTLQAGLDSFGATTASIDSNWRLTNNQALRLNALLETIDNHRDFKDGERWAINPTYTLVLDDRTRISASWEALRDDRVVDRGVPSLDGAPLRGYNETFFGDPGFNNTTLDADILRLRGERRLSANWTIDATLQYADYDKAYANLYPVNFNDDTATVTLDGYADTTDRENTIVQMNLVGDFDALGMTHTLLAGGEYGSQNTRNARRDAFFFASADDQVTFGFSDPLNIPEYRLTGPVRSTASDVTFTSAFIQDEIQLSEQWILVAGARIDRFDIRVDDFVEIADGTADGNPGRLSRQDTEVSPRAGVIWKPRSDLSVYLNYSESFLPRSGDQFLKLTPTTAALEPEAFETLEAGFKWAVGDATTLGIAVFEITRENGTVIDPSNPERSLLTGTETRGIEFELSGPLTDTISLSANYTHLDGEELGRVVGAEVANRELAQLPKHKATLWGDAQLAPRWRAGLGVIYQSEQYASLSNAVTLPSYTRVDAALYFEATTDLSVQLNLENLLDEDYYSAAHNDNNITVGAPLNARLGVSYRF
ncbi:MAG: TonB-dependent siderophore receptor [Cellvibrionales bacterium]|jgi:catecholate siderophore receptor